MGDQDTAGFLDDIEHGRPEHLPVLEPFLFSCPPTRLVAWKYSAADFGWPCTTVRPRRPISRPTEIMLVAIATSTSCWGRPGQSAATGSDNK